MKEDIDKISLVKIPKYIYEDMYVHKFRIKQSLHCI